MGTKKTAKNSLTVKEIVEVLDTVEKALADKMKGMKPEQQNGIVYALTEVRLAFVKKVTE